MPNRNRPPTFSCYQPIGWALLSAISCRVSSASCMQDETLADRTDKAFELFRSGITLNHTLYSFQSSIPARLRHKLTEQWSNRQHYERESPRDVLSVSGSRTFRFNRDLFVSPY